MTNYNSELRFCIQLSDKNHEHIKAAKFLKSLGRKKADFIARAVVEYLKNHPEDNCVANDNNELNLLLSKLIHMLEDKGLKSPICFDPNIKETSNDKDINPKFEQNKNIVTTNNDEVVDEEIEDLEEVLSALDLF